MSDNFTYQESLGGKELIRLTSIHLFFFNPFPASLLLLLCWTHLVSKWNLMDNSRYSNASWELRDHFTKFTFRQNGRHEASISSERINGCFNNILFHQWEFSTSQSDCEGMNYILSHKQRNRSLNTRENYLIVIQGANTLSVNKHVIKEGPFWTLAGE